VTGQRDEFSIIVTGGRDIEITENGARLGKATIDDAEPVRRKTIEVLQDWLGRWGVLSQHEIADLPVHRTFEVLGEQLYQMICHNGVGDAFEKKYAEARKHDRKLQVTLSFREEGRDLASLPWEFLRRPTREGSEGYFLATHVQLVLSRYIPMEEGPRALPMCQLPLKILFVMTIPPREKVWRDERSELVDTMAGLQDDPNRIQVFTIPEWIGQDINEKLRSQKPHIVHVVGVCKNEDDGIVIALPEPSGGFSWQPQINLVSVLTEGMRLEDLPRLVVLHLVQPRTDDFTATFDRLAPVLVRSGIPAVLAMRYPIPATIAKDFIKKFYQRLARGTRLGEAVQQARSSLFAGSGSRDRLFGGPVLYMQSVDEEFVSVTTGVSHPEASLMSASAEAMHQVDGFGSKVERMRNLVHRMARDDQELLDWFDAISWPRESAEAEHLIQLRMQIDGDIQRRGPIFDAMLFTLEEDPGGGDT
jgi:hypothetical protein